MAHKIGVHACIHSAKELKDYTKAVVKYMAPKGVNMAIMEINNRLLFKSFPQVSDGDISHEDLREACDALRASGVEPIPLYACFGHQGWSSRNSLLKAFPEFDESPWLKDDEDFIPNFKWESVPAKDSLGRSVCTYNPSWCGNEPKVYEVVLPLIDEIIEASGCKTIHFGMDEIIMMGECERCRHLSRAELFRKNLEILQTHCAEKNVRSMIWADRLLNAFLWYPRMLPVPGKPMAGDYDSLMTCDCIDDISKDVILCDWHYGLSPEHYTGELLSHGFTVFPSCADSPLGAEVLWHNALEEAEKQGCKDRLPGMIICCWTGGDNVLKPFENPSDPTTPESMQRLPAVLDKVCEMMAEYK